MKMECGAVHDDLAFCRIRVNRPEECHPIYGRRVREHGNVRNGVGFLDLNFPVENAEILTLEESLAPIARREGIPHTENHFLIVRARRLRNCAAAEDAYPHKESEKSPDAVHFADPGGVRSVC